jgi:hypothetical protein
MGYPRILELVEHRFYADEILSIDQKGMASFFVRGGALDLGLAQFLKTFDLIVVFGKDRDGGLIGNLSRVCQGQILPVQSFPSWNERIHLTDHLLRELSHYGFSTSDGIPKIYLNEADQRWGKQFWTGNRVTPPERAGMIILHPGSGSKKKVWAVDRFLDLMKHFQKHSGSKLLVVLGPAEGVEIRDAFERSAGEPILARGLSLIQLASVMEGCRLFIGNDSGVSHLAAALEIPTVAIFGPTDPKVWSPKGRSVAVVRQEIPCSPCPQERLFQCQHFECLKRIEMEHVLDGIRRVGLGKEASRKEVNNGRKEGWRGDQIFWQDQCGSHSSD